MCKNRTIRIPFLIAIGILILISVFGVVIQVNAQDQSASDIYVRLAQKGVPVLKVSTIQRLPYKIEIDLQSASQSDRLALEDNWFMQLAHREAALAYRIGLRLTSYRLNVYNSTGELIYAVETYLHPDDLSQNSQPGKTVIDNQSAEQTVNANLQLAGLTLDELAVIQEDTLGSNGQILLIQVSGKDLLDVNGSLPKFLSSLFQLLDTVNPQHGTNIVLCHLRVVDPAGNVLLDYVRDLEGGSTQWTAVEGLYSDWFPKPALAPTGGTPPAPIENGYPSPPTLTPQSYP